MKASPFTKPETSLTFLTAVNLLWQGYFILCAGLSLPTSSSKPECLYSHKEPVLFELPHVNDQQRLTGSAGLSGGASENRKVVMSDRFTPLCSALERVWG